MSTVVARGGAGGAAGGGSGGSGHRGGWNHGGGRGGFEKSGLSRRDKRKLAWALRVLNENGVTTAAECAAARAVYMEASYPSLSRFPSLLLQHYILTYVPSGW